MLALIKYIAIRFTGVVLMLERTIELWSILKEVTEHHYKNFPLDNVKNDIQQIIMFVDIGTAIFDVFTYF